MIGKPIFALALILAAAEGTTLSLSARNLPSMDIFNGAPDAYVKVYWSPAVNGQYQLIGETDYVLDDRNPEWSKKFDIPNNGGPTQMLKFDIYDSDSPDADDYMGYVELRYSEILNDADGFLALDILGGEPGGGQLQIKRTS